jgi:hypothetical protein
MRKDLARRGFVASFAVLGAAGCVGCGSSSSGSPTNAATPPADAGLGSEGGAPGLDASTDDGSSPDAGGTTDSGGGPRQLDPCGKGDYCFASPHALGWDLYSVYIGADDDVWVAGDPGQIAHYDGKAWTQISLHTADSLQLVGSAANDVWAYSTGHLFHFDGARWSAVILPGGQPAERLAPVGPGDAWAQVSETSFYHWDGTAWTMGPAIALTTPNLVGAGPGNLWIWGEKAPLQLVNGTWQTVSPAPAVPSFSPILPLGAGSAWDIEDGMNAISVWNGSSWSAGTPPPQKGAYFGRKASDVWVAPSYDAEHWNGTAWSNVMTPGDTPPNAIDGSTSTWAVGPAGSILKLNGSAFVAQNTPVTTPATYLAAHAYADNDVVLVGAEVFAHWNGTALTVQVGPAQTEWNAVDGASSSDYFVVGVQHMPDMTGTGTIDSGAAAHVVGGQATTLALPTSPAAPVLNAVYVASPTNVYAAGFEGTIVHYDGQAWTYVSGWAPMNTRVKFDSILGRSPTDIWVAGAGIMAHYDGNAWTSITDSAAILSDELCPGSGKEIWAASYNGVVHYDGTTWQLESWPPNWPPQQDSTTLTQCAAGGNDVYFTSADGLVVHWDGTKLSEDYLYRQHASGWLNAVAASPMGTLWFAYTGGGLVFHQP